MAIESDQSRSIALHTIGRACDDLKGDGRAEPKDVTGALAVNLAISLAKGQNLTSDDFKMAADYCACMAEKMPATATQAGPSDSPAAPISYQPMCKAGDLPGAPFITKTTVHPKPSNGSNQ